MFKHLSLLIGIAFYCSKSNAQQGQSEIWKPTETLEITNLTTYGLKGSVKSLSEIYYHSYEYPNLEQMDFKHSKPTSIDFFDNTGRFINSYTIDSKGRMDTFPRLYARFDSQGRRIEYSYYDDFGNLNISKCEYTEEYCQCTYYDQTGTNEIRKEKIFFYEDGSIDKILSDDGTYVADYDYKKNDQGLVNEYSTEEIKVYFSYNSNGLVNKIDLGGNPYYIIEYDDNGRLSKECTYSGCGPIGSSEIVACDCESWKYNKNGDLISWTGERMPNTSPFSFPHPSYSWVYEYDKKGNWTKRLFYDDGKLSGVAIRIITYY